MSQEIWPPISAEDLEVRIQENEERELKWYLSLAEKACHELKRSLEDCYALLAPIDPGSTLVMSTSRSEKVKGTITRVGTRIVKGSLNLQLRTIPPQAIIFSPNCDYHIQALERVHTNLTQSIDLLGVTLYKLSDEPSAKSSAGATPTTQVKASELASSLTLLSETLTECRSLLAKPPKPHTWQAASCPPTFFSPPLPPTLSFFLAIEDCQVMLYLRALEDTKVPLHLSLKLGLALGTYRRLEHDEMDQTFTYDPNGMSGDDGPVRHHPHDDESPHASKKEEQERLPKMEVNVREKVMVRTGDPSLISLNAKLGQLIRDLDDVRSNLAAVMRTDKVE